MVNPRLANKPGQKVGESSSKPKIALECAFCEGPHYSDDCPVEKTVEEAKECAAEKHLCFKCFHQPESTTTTVFL